MWEDNDSCSCGEGSNCSACSYMMLEQQRPIVVGYAFGPKKMSTMGVVMAEASRAEVIHEEDEGEDEDLMFATETTSDRNNKTESSLTSAALKGLERKQTSQNSTIISLGNSNDTNLKHIVRYFRSSCSSAAASMSETTVSTPTTATTFCSATISSTHSQQQRQLRRFPVRISFVPLDPGFPIDEQHGGQFDLILHKLTEDILSMKTSDTSWDRVQRLTNYARDQRCCLVDHPQHVQTLMSRSDIARVLQSCLQGVTSASGIPVQAPKVVVLNEQADTQSLQQQLRDANLSVPLIVKPLIAAGTKQSHYMTIVLQSRALQVIPDADTAMLDSNDEQPPIGIPPKSLIQEYVNHDAILYKVYVLGDNIHVYERPSLPNLPHSYTTSKDLVEFDSQRPYPRLHDFGITPNQQQQHHKATRCPFAQGSTSSSNVTPVTEEEVRPLVQALKQAFGLDLFGFDILIKNSSSQTTQTPAWLVVDVNYFPSYKEVPNFPSLLAHYLTQRVLEQRKARNQLHYSNDSMTKTTTQMVTSITSSSPLMTITNGVEAPATTAR